MKKICILICLIFILTTKSVFAVDISSQYCCVIEPVTHTIVYEKNAHEKHSMASTTKIMTALVAIEKSKLDDIVTVSKNAATQEGSSIYLRVGDKISMEDLLYGIMLNSGNDAAVAMAEHICGNVDDFAKLMTQKAIDIGAKNTQFKNPNGLDQEGHYTTAYDLAIITSYAMQNDIFCNIVKTQYKTATLQNNGDKLYFTNHNKLLKIYDGAIGVKTGYTKATGRCLVSATERNGLRFIIVTLDAPDDWNDHKKLLDNSFDNYEIRTILKKDDKIKDANIDGQIVPLILDSDVKIPIQKDKPYKVNISLQIIDNLTSPINKREKVGVAHIIYNNQEISNVDVLCSKDVQKCSKINTTNGFFHYFKKIVEFLLM